MQNIKEINTNNVLKTSKDLLKSEYVSEGEHVLHTLQKQDKGALKTFQMKCESLSKVKKLLPQMLEAQNKLKEKSESELNIENIEGCDKIIEMNISLFEEPPSSSDSENSDDETFLPNNEEESEDELTEDDDDESEVSDASESEDETNTNTNTKPLIEEIPDKSDDADR